MDAAGLDVVLGCEVVAAEDGVLEDIDAADGEPAQRGDHGHDEALADDVFELVGQLGDGGQDDEQDGQEEDRPRGAAKVLLQTPAETGGLGFFVTDDAEENVVEDVCEDERSAEEEDGEEPAVAEVEGVGHRH